MMKIENLNISVEIPRMESIITSWLMPVYIFYIKMGLVPFLLYKIIIYKG